MPPVRILRQITGSRDGVDWPAPGGVLDVPADEAAQLVEQRIAEPIVESAAAPVAETAAAPKPRTRKS